MSFHSNVVQLLEQSSFADAEDSDSEYESNDEEVEKSVQDQTRSSPKHRTLSEVFEELQRGVRRLNDLNACLHTPVLDYGLEVDEKTKSAISEVSPHQIFNNCIHERFQNASEDLVDYLGRISLQRYQRLQRLRVVNEESVAINVSDMSTKYSSSNVDDSGYGTAPKAPSEGEVSGSLAAYAPTLVPSVISSWLSSLAEGGRSKYPKLPDGAKSGDLFECAACGRFIRATGKHEYRYV
jgi:hypothetical protein